MPTVGAEALADTVEHHDGVVQRIADDRKNGGDGRQVKGCLRQREDAHHQDRIMNDGEDRAQGQPPGMKAQGDIDEDADQGEEQRQLGAALQLTADLRTHDIRWPAPARPDPHPAAPWSPARGWCSHPASAPRGGRRMETSREVPKLCTCGSRIARPAPWPRARHRHWPQSGRSPECSRHR